MKIGDYVRTINGKIWIIKSQKAISGHKKDIINYSENLIDLIEVGDYVNGYYVENIRHRYDGEMITTLEVATGSNYFQTPMFEEDIKSIVTKECFESMEYKVGEDNEKQF